MRIAFPSLALSPTTRTAPHGFPRVGWPGQREKGKRGAGGPCAVARCGIDENGFVIALVVRDKTEVNFGRDRSANVQPSEWVAPGDELETAWAAAPKNCPPPLARASAGVRPERPRPCQAAIHNAGRPAWLRVASRFEEVPPRQLKKPRWVRESRCRPAGAKVGREEKDFRPFC